MGVVGRMEGVAGAVKITFTAAIAEETKSLLREVKLSSMRVRFGMADWVRV